MQKSFIVLCTLLLTAGPLQAEVTRLDPVVVTATRTATALSQIASSVTVITAEEIEAKQQPRVLDVLRSIPGVTILQQGPTGANSSVFLRGTDNKHTLVLIDGIEFKDTSTIGGGANLANLSVDNIEQIEVVRGAQSVLYGSDAIGGVINIITRKGTQTPQGYASVEGGSYNTWRENAGFSIAKDVVSTAFAISRTDTDGYSSYNEDDGFSENDGYKNTSVSLNIGVKPTETFAVNVNLRTTTAKYEYDSDIYDFTTSSSIPTEEGIYQDSRELMGRVEGVLNLLDNRWKMTVGASRTETKRDYWDDSKYDGKSTKFDLLNTFRVNQTHTLVAGIENEKEEFNSYYFGTTDGHATTKALFLQEQLTIGNLSAAIGVRFDDHENFGNQTTWRVAPTYNFKQTGTRIKGSVGTGFKAPTLYQLFSSYGDKNLDAEESFSWDIGVEQNLFNNSFIVSVTWFSNDIDDYIDFDYSTYTYQNVSKYKTRGIESTITWYPTEMIDVQLGYSYTDSEDKDGSRLARRPLHKGTVDCNLYPTEKWQINLNAIYTSDRYDGDYSGETLPSYTLINLATSYQINNALKLFGRVDNLFDEDYEEVAGYGTAGVSGYAGIKLSF